MTDPAAATSQAFHELVETLKGLETKLAGLPWHSSGLAGTSP